MIFIMEVLLAIMVVFKWWCSSKDRKTKRETEKDEVSKRGRKRQRETIDREETTRGSKNKNRQQKGQAETKRDKEKIGVCVSQPRDLC